MHAVNTAQHFAKNNYGKRTINKATSYVSRVSDSGLDIVNATVILPKNGLKGHRVSVSPSVASKTFARNGGIDNTLIDESIPPSHKNAVVDSCIPFGIQDNQNDYPTEMLHAGEGVFACTSGKSQFLIIPIIDDGFFLYDETLVRAPKKLAEEKHETTIVLDNIEEQNNTTKNDEEQGEINLDGENRTLDQIAYEHAKILPREERKAQSMISHGRFPSLSEISAILTSEKRAIQFMICRGVLRPPVNCERCGSK